MNYNAEGEALTMEMLKDTENTILNEQDLKEHCKKVDEFLSLLCFSDFSQTCLSRQMLIWGYVISKITNTRSSKA